MSAIGLGGWHLGFASGNREDCHSHRSPTRSIAALNFLDNSWDYNDGKSEVRMGKALRDGYREMAFLMTKIDGRSKIEATRQFGRVPPPLEDPTASISSSITR